MDLLSAPVSTAKGVGPKREEQLGRMGIETVRDLVLHLPASWEVRPEATPIAAVRPGTEVVVEGEVAGRSFRFGRGRRRTLAVELDDGTGRLTALFFQQAYLADRFPDGRQVKLWGRVDDKGRLAMPRTESEKSPFPPAGERVPVYPVRDGIGRGWLRALIHRTLDEVLEALDERLGEADLERLNMAPLGEAVAVLHRPGAADPPEAARRRLAFEELLRLARARELRRRARAGGSAPALAVDDGLHERILARFPFQPTGAQARVIAEIRSDLGQPAPMARLLQGDVGSGKTAVLLYACLAAVGRGRQAAILAPTSILAEQHYDQVCRWLEGSRVKIACVDGRMPAGERARLAGGGADLLVGTHALVSKGLAFSDLAVAVVDEQHRFGVSQRRALAEKGGSVHMLSTTATPIPRTPAHVLYGDLDLSVLDEAPAVRSGVETQRLDADNLDQAWAVVDERLAAGGRAFWVCPRIEGDAPSVEARAVWLAEKLGRVPAVVHGRMPLVDRRSQMDAFRSGAEPLLLATSVVEVGVDVPEADTVVIEGADRFGLATLHQIRGRTGRADRPGLCLVMADEANERVAFFAGCTDGFELADMDLATRGPGDLGGLAQSGAAPFLLADLDRHRDLLDEARRVVQAETATAVPG